MTDALSAAGQSAGAASNATPLATGMAEGEVSAAMSSANNLGEESKAASSTPVPTTPPPRSIFSLKSK